MDENVIPIQIQMTTYKKCSYIIKEGTSGM